MRGRESNAVAAKVNANLEQPRIASGRKEKGNRMGERPVLTGWFESIGVNRLVQTSRLTPAARQKSERLLIEDELLGVDQRPEDVLVGELLVLLILRNVRQRRLQLRRARLVAEGPE